MKTEHKLKTQSLIQAQLIDALYHHLPSSLLALFCVTSIIFWVLYSVGEEKNFFTWYVGLNCVLILRSLLFLWYNRTSAEKSLQKYHYYLFILGSSLTGLFLGILGSFLMPDHIMYQALIIILICGVIAGAAQSLSASFLAYIIYLYLTLSPLLIWEFIQILNNDLVYIGIFIGMIIFCIFSSITARREYLMLINHIKLEHDYKILLKNMSTLKNTYKEKSIHDPLTGLYNRRFLDEYLDIQIEIAKRQALKISVHKFGDQILQIFGKKLLATVRKSDIVCRYGGEEFIIVLLDASIDAAKHVAENLRTAIKSIIIQDKSSVINNIAASFGVSGFPLHGQTRSDLIESADKALYHAKKAGRDTVYTFQTT